MENKKLTEEELEEIAELVVCKLEKRLYTNVGKGMVAIVGKILLYAIIVIASYSIGSSNLKL